MHSNSKAKLTIIASCAAIFLPGSLLFGFPGIGGYYWQNTFHTGKAEIGLILFYVLAAAGIFMFIIGRLQEIFGPRFLMSMGTLICASSMIVVGYASSMKLVYVWAAMMGVSTSFLYLPAITAAQLWYPRRRGMVSGIVSMFFGLAGALMSPIFSRMLQVLGYKTMTFILGFATLLIGFAATIFVRLPEGLPPLNSTFQDSAISLTSSLTVFQSLKTRTFWLMWFVYAFAGAAGISMVTFSTSYGISKGLSISDAAFILMSFNMTNGLSRLASGFLSDRIDRKTIMSAAFFSAGVAYLIFPYPNDIIIWLVLAAFIGFAFGTLFAVSAPFISDCFGMEHFGSIFGLIFTAYGFFAGILGPWIGGYLLDITGGNFIIVFTYLGCLMLLSCLMLRFSLPVRECNL